MDSYGKRLITARKHAGLNQSALARKIHPPIKPQAIQYLEDPKSKATGSRHTNEIAAACGVNADWLATGRGSMLAGTIARQDEAKYETLANDALQVAIAWSKLDPESQAMFRELIFMRASLERRTPWLRRGRPRGESYDEYEQRMEQNYRYLVSIEARRLKQS